MKTPMKISKQRAYLTINSTVYVIYTIRPYSILLSLFPFNYMLYIEYYDNQIIIFLTNSKKSFSHHSIQYFYDSNIVLIDY